MYMYVYTYMYIEYKERAVTGVTAVTPLDVG